MNVTSDLSAQCKKSLWLVLDFLLDQFGIAEDRKLTWRRIGRADEDDWSDWPALGEALGLRISKVTLTVAEATQACGSQVALVGE